MPYELDGLALKVRNGVLLWPRMNLDAFTDIEDPQTVYMRQQNNNTLRSRDSNRNDFINFVARIRFNVDHIEIVETTKPLEYDTSAERIENLQKLQDVFRRWFFS